MRTEHFEQNVTRARKLAALALFVLPLFVYIVLPVGAMVGFWIGPRQATDIFTYILSSFVGSLFLSFAMLLLMVVASKCYLYAKRLRTRSALEVLARDNRRPVVYFRPFTADLDAKKVAFQTFFWTQEEALAKAMNDFGPFVAIGAPAEKETVPLLGAARMYVPNEKWQEVALDLLERANIVVMRIGSSPGFWWEFETVTQRVKPEKLVLLIPPDQELYEKFRVASQNVLPTYLPPFPYDPDYGGRPSGAVIFFNSKWAPSIVELRRVRVPYLRGSGVMSLTPLLQMALRPVYENAGLRWTGPPINAWKLWGLAIIAGVFVYFTVGMIYMVSTPDWLHR